jgi:[ribosomal protein S18]-alanine N-acetyltransferase
MTNVRPARGSDLDAMCELETLCFGREAWSRALVQAELDADDRTVLVAEDGAAGAGGAGGVVGYVTTVLALPSADLLRIGVHPRRRRVGVARALLEATLAVLPGLGCEEILLEVNSENVAALRLYTWYGFERISVRRGYYDGGRGDALLLRLDLHARRPAR